MSKNRKRQKRQQGEVHGFNWLSGKFHGMISRGLSNLRLSITFRIALHYCWQLLRTTLVAALVIALVFFGAQIGMMQRAVDRIALQAPDAENAYTQAIVQYHGAEAKLVDAVFPADFFGALGYRMSVATLELFTPQPRLTLASAHENATLHVIFDMEEPLRTFGWLMIGLALTEIIRMLHFINKRHRLDKRVLAPIRDMTDMAATLSASNLSNRLNIDGTKNELKDLAQVINTMLDRIERSYNSQKQFVSDASHELRTPIAVIQGYVNMLNRWGKEDKTVLDEGIAAIAQETASMKDLVENLLFLARHDKKTLMMEIEQFDPCDLVAEVHREAAMVTPDDNFVLRPMEHCTVEADRNMIKQVMRILCDNAVKYSPRGGTITMGVEHTATGCVLTLSDNGPGISQEELPKIFDRFYRSDSARKAENGGHGLGLSIARIIIVAHGGKIRVRSKVGEGTTFAIVLPEKQGKHTANLEQSTDKQSPAKPSSAA